MTCSQSGELSKLLVREWSQKVFPHEVSRLHSESAVLYVDSWGGHKASELYESPGATITVKVSPEGATSIVQPLDVYCFQH